MTTQVEQETKPVVPEAIQVRKEELEIPPEVERVTGVRPRPVQVTAKVTDDTGKPLIQTPSTQSISVTIPADQQKLTLWSQGSPTASLTWFASFWLRIIKKAIHFGWKVITRGEVE